ncbi:hypothetical protein ACJX0J_015224, partial [Zea mays]
MDWEKCSCCAHDSPPSISHKIIKKLGAELQAMLFRDQIVAHGDAHGFLLYGKLLDYVMHTHNMHRSLKILIMETKCDILSLDKFALDLLLVLILMLMMISFGFLLGQPFSWMPTAMSPSLMWKKHLIYWIPFSHQEIDLNFSLTDCNVQGLFRIAFDKLELALNWSGYK